MSCTCRNMARSTSNLLAFALVTLLACQANACTLIAVGKNATVDGSVIVAHTDDAGGGTSDVRLSIVPAMDWPEGSQRPVYHTRDGYPRIVSKTRGPDYMAVGDQKESTILGHIPQVNHTYAYIDQDYGLINEHQLIIGETTTSAKTAGWPTDTPGGKCMFGIEELSKVAMERCKSARCAIQTMGDLAYEHGFYSADSGQMSNPSYADSSETLAIGDKYGEVWMFHVMTGLDQSSAVWAAQRIPDDHIGVSANAFMIREMDLDDKDNFMASPNIHSAAIEAGWWSHESPEPFDFTRVYAYGGASTPLYSLYSGRRTWRIYDVVAPSLRLDPKWGWAPERPSYPISLKPDKKVSVQQILDILRDTYNGTEYSMSQGLGAGPFGAPIRWDGPNHGVPGGWERPISMYRTTFSFASQARPHLPDEIGAVTHFGYDAPHGTAYVPFYANQKSLPESYKRGKMSQFSTDSAWWAFNFVNNWSLLRSDHMLPDIRAEAARLESEGDKEQKEAEKKAEEFCEAHKCDTKKVLEILEEFSNKHASKVVSQWWDLAWRLVARYTNGYLTTSEDEGGQKALGYPKEWLERSDFNGWPGISYYMPGHEPSHGIYLPPPAQDAQAEHTATDEKEDESVLSAAADIQEENQNYQPEQSALETASTESQTTVDSGLTHVASFLFGAACASLGAVLVSFRSTRRRGYSRLP